MPKKQVTGVSLSVPVVGGGGGVSWQLVPSDRDLARRVVIVLEDRRVLTTHRHHWEEAEFCRQSVDQIRRFLVQELLNTQSPDLERCLKAMLIACRAFVSTAGPHSKDFQTSPRLFEASLDSLRAAIGRQLGELRSSTGVLIPMELETIIPQQDLSWIPGIEDAGDDA